MKKLIKISAITAILLVTLLIIAIIALPSLVDTDGFREQLSKQVKQHTGQDLQIEGELSVSIFPWLGIRTGSLALSQPTFILEELKDNITETNRHLLKVKEAEIKVKLLPLIRGQLEVDTVQLNQPQLAYLVSATGKTSIDSITAAAPTETGEATNEAQSTPAQETTPAGNEIIIAGIAIKNGDLVYHDLQTGERLAISNISIETGNLLSRDSAPVNVSATLKPSNSEPIDIALDANAAIDTSNKLISMDKLLLTIKEQAKTYNLTGTIQGIQFSQGEQLLTINGIDLNAAHDGLKPTLSIPSMTVDLSRYSTSPIAFVLNEKTLKLSATGNVMLKDWDKQLLVKGKLSTNTFSPKTMIRYSGIDYTPSHHQALEKLSISTNINAGENGVSLKNIELLLDESQLKGDASIINFSKLAYRFDVNLDKINLDHYLPKAETPSSSSQTTQKNASNNSGLALIAPVHAFKGLNANGRFRAGKIITNGATLSQLHVDIASSEKNVTITPTATLYDGSLKSKITFIEQAKQSTLKIEKQLNNVQLGPLLKDTDIIDTVSGKGFIDATVTIVENNQSKEQNNHGTIAVKINDGTLKNVDLKKVLDQGQIIIDNFRGKSTNAVAKDNQQTRFAEMTATMRLNNNIIKNNDLRIKAPAFRVKGKGTIHLAKDDLEYKTTIVAVNTNEGQGGKQRKELEGIVIPVKFYGQITAPKYKIDEKALLKENTKKLRNKEKAKLKRKLAKELGLEDNSSSTDESKKSDTSSEDQIKDQLKKKLLDNLLK